MIEQHLPDVDTPTAYDDVITIGRTRARRRTVVVVAAAAVAVAVALVGLKALDQGRKPDVVTPPRSPVNWILAETASGLQLVDPHDGAMRFAPDRRGTFAAWSPDGGQIAYVVAASDDSFRDLWMASATTDAKKRLAHCEGCKVLGADWSPDGTDIAYTVLLKDGTSKLEVIEGGRTATMAVLSSGSDWGWPQWSPDGKAIALGESTRNKKSYVDLLEVDHSLTSGLPVTGTPRRIAGPIEGLKRLSWSPDGRDLAFTAGADDLDPGFTSNLFVVGADGRGLRQVTHVQPGVRLFAVEWEPGDPDYPFLVSLAEDGVDYTDSHLARVSPNGSVTPTYLGGAPVKAFRATYRF
jgi:Tol biopolymer transport system component